MGKHRCVSAFCCFSLSLCVSLSHSLSLYLSVSTDDAPAVNMSNAVCTEWPTGSTTELEALLDDMLLFYQFVEELAAHGWTVSDDVVSDASVVIRR